MTGEATAWTGRWGCVELLGFANREVWVEERWCERLRFDWGSPISSGNFSVTVSLTSSIHINFLLRKTKSQPSPFFFKGFLSTSLLSLGLPDCWGWPPRKLPKNLPMSFSSSPYITTWTMGLVWGEGGGKGAGEGQDCKWNPNYGTRAPLNILLKPNGRSVYWQRRNCRTHFSTSDKLLMNYLLCGYQIKPPLMNCIRRISQWW